jgi:Mn2+/Fe2+ NRAMP family transporter
MFTSPADNRHATQLEWAILILIAVEITLTLTSLAREGAAVLAQSLAPVVLFFILAWLVVCVTRKRQLSTKRFGLRSR